MTLNNAIYFIISVTGVYLFILCMHPNTWAQILIRFRITRNLKA